MNNAGFSAGVAIRAPGGFTTTGTITGVSVGTLYKTGGGNLTFASPVSLAAANVVVSGANNLILENTAPNFNGTLTIDPASAVLLRASGTLANIQSITIYNGATLGEDNTAGTFAQRNLLNRVNSGASITMYGGNLVLTGNAGSAVASAETLGTITLAAGNNEILTSSNYTNAGYSNMGVGANWSATPNTATPNVQLNIAGLIRDTGATAVFLGNNTQLGTNQNEITIGTINGGATTAALASGILPWAMTNEVANQLNSVNPSDFATYSTTGGIAPFTNYVTDLSLAGPTSNVRISANQALTSSLTVNSILIIGSATFGTHIVEHGYTLTVASGAIASYADTQTVTDTITGGTINLGNGTATEGIISTPANTTLQVSSTISGTGGITITGSTATGGGATVLLGNNSITGQTSLDSGTLTVAGASAISNTSTDTLYLSGGTLNAAAGLTLNDSNIYLYSSTVALSGSAPITFNNSTVNMLGFVQLTINDTSGVYFTGPLTGAGSLSLTGGGVVFLSNSNNNYTGVANQATQTIIGGPTVVVPSATALGPAGEYLFINSAASTIVATVPITFNDLIVLNSSLTLGGTEGSDSFTFGTPTQTLGAGQFPVELTANVTITPFVPVQIVPDRRSGPHDPGQSADRGSGPGLVATVRQ